MVVPVGTKRDRRGLVPAVSAPPTEPAPPRLAVSPPQWGYDGVGPPHSSAPGERARVGGRDERVVPLPVPSALPRVRAHARRGRAGQPGGAARRAAATRGRGVRVAREPA